MQSSSSCSSKWNLRCESPAPSPQVPGHSPTLPCPALITALYSFSLQIQGRFLCSKPIRLEAFEQISSFSGFQVLVIFIICASLSFETFVWFYYWFPYKICIKGWYSIPLDKICVLCLVTQSCPTLWASMDCSPPGSSVHGESPGKHTGVGCHALLQGIFPTQGWNPGLMHCRQILNHLSHQEAHEYWSG